MQKWLNLKIFNLDDWKVLDNKTTYANAIMRRLKNNENLFKFIL
jgi:hypothetical protein